MRQRRVRLYARIKSAKTWIWFMDMMIRKFSELGRIQLEAMGWRIAI